VIGHHDCVVDDDAERDSNPRQGIEMYLELKKIIEDKGDQYIGNKAYCYYKKIFELAADRKHKKKEKDDGKYCPEDIF
jgi:hypothetical protein